MNSTVKGVLIFVGGLVIGAAGGGYAAYTITKRYFEKENRDAVNELAEYYHKKYDDIPKKGDENNEPRNKEKCNDKIRTAEEEKDIYEETSGIYRPSEEERKQITDYSSHSNRSDSVVNTNTEPKNKKGRKKKPYIIDEATWDANEANYDKRFISYYEADNTLVDDESDTPVDIMHEIGEFNLNDADYDIPIIIANDQFKTMYMVNVEPRAWSEEGL